ncbi:MAG: hypothetical protein WC175_04395 [Candidatus Dojkabacteria bacterium]|jgi:hypothetical protein
MAPRKNKANVVELRRSLTIPSIKQNALSDQLYDACIAKARENPGPEGTTPWLHLKDAVDRGTISPMEAYDALEAGFLPEHLKIRKSLYYHLL